MRGNGDYLNRTTIKKSQRKSSREKVVLNGAGIIEQPYVKCKLYSTFLGQEVSYLLENTSGCSSKYWVPNHISLSYMSSELLIMTVLLNSKFRGLWRQSIYYKRNIFIPSLEQIPEFKELKNFIMFFALREILFLFSKAVCYMEMICRNKNMSSQRQSMSLLIWCAEIWDLWRISPNTQQWGWTDSD